MLQQMAEIQLVLCWFDLDEDCYMPNGMLDMTAVSHSPESNRTALVEESCRQICFSRGFKGGLLETEESDITLGSNQNRYTILQEYSHLHCLHHRTPLNVSIVAP